MEFDDGSRGTTVGVFKDHNQLYASLTDIAAALSASTFDNPATKKLELKGASCKIVATSGNSFITIIDPRGKRSIFQLSNEVIGAAGTYFVPLTSFIPLFRIAWSRWTTYDSESHILHLSSTTTGNGLDFSTLKLEAKTNGMVIRIPTTRRFDDFESWLKQDGWLYVTISGAKADVGAINKLTPAGLVKKIVAIQSPTSVQLTFKIAGKLAASEMMREEGTNNILISLRSAGSEEKELLEKKRREVQQGLESQRKRWEMDVIVLDPGHGGKDYGAIGVTKVKEKDIALGIALKLGKLLEKGLKGVKVVYTRKDDSFVELQRRGQIANEADGKLFISIHCNSLPRKPNPTRGFEVYLLRPGKTEDAIEIAERENAVIEMEEGYKQRYQRLTEENFILVTMAQSAHMKASEFFADIAQQELQDHALVQRRLLGDRRADLQSAAARGRGRAARRPAHGVRGPGRGFGGAGALALGSVRLADQWAGALIPAVRPSAP